LKLNLGLFLQDIGEKCDINRIHKRIKQEGIKAKVGCRKPRHCSGNQHVVVPNPLQREFTLDASHSGWVSDIAYTKLHQDWLYLAVVLDLFSRKIADWPMHSLMTKQIVLYALLMAVWRKKPTNQVMVHLDQESQCTSHEWHSFLQDHGLKASMSRRGNCQDNAVAESFFKLLKQDRIK
jgi:putative transposase